MSEFRVVKRLESDGAVIIEPDGDLDLQSARLLASVLAHSVGRAHPHATVVEAHCLRTVDEAAVRFLAVAWPRDELGRPRSRIWRENVSVRRVFELNGAADLLADPSPEDFGPDVLRPDLVRDFGGGVASRPGAKAG